MPAGSGFDSGSLDPSTDPAGPWPDVTELPGASVSTTAPVTDSPSASSSATETRAGESTGASQSEPTACPTDPCGGFVSVKFGNGGAHPRHSADGRATAETSATDTTATDTTPTCDTATSSTTSSTSDSAE